MCEAEDARAEEAELVGGEAGRVEDRPTLRLQGCIGPAGEADLGVRTRQREIAVFGAEIAMQWGQLEWHARP